MKSIINNVADKISALNFLAISIGLVYLFFGILKFFSSLSPAEDLAIQTINSLTFNIIPEKTSIFLLALWETFVGACLLFNFHKKAILILALVHMFFTFTPLVLAPEITFSEASFAPTLLGQYIFKNVVIVAALATLLKDVNKKRKLTLITNQ
ncbi:doxx family protein [Cellulophaga sp. L1A9]|uniref:doxx family protein n=1 Tax=Cellulophaga sp. L1A9 TaxID=2686362 RepID=UPI0018EF01DD|nr:doxx family protein [Cellulophaga sp. L1A9]